MEQGMDIQLKVLQTVLPLLSHYASIHGELLAEVGWFVFVFIVYWLCVVVVVYSVYSITCVCIHIYIKPSNHSRQPLIYFTSFYSHLFYITLTTHMYIKPF